MSSRYIFASDREKDLLMSNSGPNPESAPAPNPAPQESSNQTTGKADQAELFTVSDRRVLAIICLILLSWAGLRILVLSNWKREEIVIRRQAPITFAYVVDVNRATWIELSLLDGIGEVLGKRIVTFREEQGPFQSIEELRKIEGIGPKTFEKIRPQIQLTVPDSANPPK